MEEMKGLDILDSNVLSANQGLQVTDLSRNRGNIDKSPFSTSKTMDIGAHGIQSNKP